MTDALSTAGCTLEYHTANTLIIGSGAAALNAAVTLCEAGQRDIIIATDCWGGGTSNNSGSDKQTYYKLSLAGDTADSPLAMARELFSGGCMHGDIALCEANHSAEAFFHLVRLGVPFPRTRHGGYPGYKTDHDSKGRGTSAGPLTSRLMVQALAARVRDLGIPVMDGYEVISLLTAEEEDGNRVCGAVALNRKKLNEKHFGLTVYNTVNIIMATGGPAGIYADSVYPESQTGSHGLAFKAGAAGQNLTESQFGIASAGFRWNLSGTYQQVMPRYISTAKDGTDEQAFLQEYFPNTSSLCEAIFLKGYQWPFDPRKLRNHGSSLIDLLVYRERVIRGRQVFLDYRRNPADDFSFDLLSPEVRNYLEKSQGLRGTPIERLAVMNQPAIDLFASNGTDLANDMLEIAVCAQHNNGGLKADIWWESNIRHLFPVGEVCGTHGVYRPGGSALNSGQVGSRRAALYIARTYDNPPPKKDQFRHRCGPQLQKLHLTIEGMLADPRDDSRDPLTVQKQIQQRMTACAAHIRNPDTVREAADAAELLGKDLPERLRIRGPGDLPQAFKTLDLCLTHRMYLQAIAGYLARGGLSRGSCLVTSDDLSSPVKAWDYRLTGEKDFVSSRIQETVLRMDGTIEETWVPVRPVPDEPLWFETVYNTFIKTGNMP